MHRRFGVATIAICVGLVIIDGGCSRKELAPSACRGDVGPFTGQATHYDADGTGNCSFEASPDDMMVAAINHTDYEGAGWCGSCVTVAGPDGEVTVRITDSCPGCKRGDLDLSKEAFAKIAPLNRGRIPITWRPTACNVNGPIAYKFKDRSNAYWTAIQVRNHRYAIAKLEVADAQGTFKEIKRVDYNYFVDTKGLGDKPLTLRVTDTRANVISEVGIAPGANVTRQGTAQFRVCP